MLRYVETSLLGDWLPVLSALLGAAIGGGLLLVADAVRWRRERSVRYEDKRREIYVDFLTALEQSFRATMDAVHPGNPSPEEAWHEARAHWIQASACVNDISLLAPQPVIDAGGQLLLAHKKFNDLLKVDQGVDVARGVFDAMTQRDPKSWRAVHDITAPATDAFLAAARIDINP